MGLKDFYINSFSFPSFLSLSLSAKLVDQSTLSLSFISGCLFVSVCLFHSQFFFYILVLFLSGVDLVAGPWYLY